MKMEILNQTKLQSKNSALDSRISDIATHPSLPNQVLLPASAAAAALSAAQVLLAISDGELQVWDLRVCIPAAQSSETMHCRRTKLRQWWPRGPPPGTHPTQSRIDVRTASYGRQTRLTVVVEGLWSSANPCVAFSCSKTALQTVDLRTRRGVERPTCGTAAELRCSGACSSLFDWDLPANSVQMCASSPSRPFEVFAVVQVDACCCAGCSFLRCTDADDVLTDDAHSGCRVAPSSSPLVRQSNASEAFASMATWPS